MSTKKQTKKQAEPTAAELKEMETAFVESKIEALHENRKIAVEVFNTKYPTREMVLGIMKLGIDADLLLPIAKDASAAADKYGGCRDVDSILNFIEILLGDDDASKHLDVAYIEAKKLYAQYIAMHPSLVIDTYFDIFGDEDEDGSDDSDDLDAA